LEDGGLFVSGRFIPEGRSKGLSLVLFQASGKSVGRYGLRFIPLSYLPFARGIESRNFQSFEGQRVLSPYLELAFLEWK
jgi:hypothetical protein